ncbi:unnamed protein product, partial [Ilex paraguariensis]
SSSSSKCIFAILISTEEIDVSNKIISEPQVIWSANRDNPVKINATLELTQDGDLVLADVDGTLVWSTNTSGKYASGLNLTEMGNLVLFDTSNTTVWQSFDHPTDSLVFGQTLNPRQKLTASISTYNSSRGMYSFAAAKRRLIAYIESNPPQLVELKDIDYFVYRSDLRDEMMELEDCMNTCLKNCTCKAAVFAYNSDPLRGVQTSSSGSLLAKKSRGTPSFILGASLGAFIGVLLMMGACFFLVRRITTSKEVEEDYLDQVPGMPTRFAYKNLKDVTENFNKKLGEGGFGSVFEWTLSNGTKVAVKHLSALGQVKKSFLAEIETIGSIHHVNLVRLIGFCAEKSYRLLVHEYMCNGSLDRWIFRRNQEDALGWQSRRKIILDIAKGLAYLHEDCRQKIFHLDIKPQNILLDENFNAKVSDFGLSKLIDKDQSQVVTTLRGTLGYMAPEWLGSIITEKVDVYSFGVMVLEIVCGRKNLDRFQPEEDKHLLCLFQRKARGGQLSDMVDKCSEDMQLHGPEIVETMRLADWCLQSDFKRRPYMSTVVKVLEGYVDVESDLDYNFVGQHLSRTTATICEKEDVVRAATPLLPSVLSGPR